MQSIELVPDLIRGALDLEPTADGLLPHRLPARAREQFPDPQILMAESQPSGVRLAFRTAATAIELDTHRTVVTYRGAPPRPEGVYDLVVDGALVASASTGGGTVITVDMVTGAGETAPGPAGTVRFALPGGERDVEIWLPTHETTRLVSLRADASRIVSREPCTGTDASSTGRRTSRSCRCPTPCTPTPRPTSGWGSGSRPSRSPRAGRSPERRMP